MSGVVRGARRGLFFVLAGKPAANLSWPQAFDKTAAGAASEGT
jgi:hypothetical protein